jgi:hypothetical protein
VPLVRTALVNIVAGTATYALPADFLRLLEFRVADAFYGVSLTGGGLVPLASDYVYRFNIIGSNLVFDYTPTFNEVRQLRYAAMHVLTTGAYADMAPTDSDAILLKARADLLRQRAASEAINGWSYRIGDESVDKKGLSDSLFKAAAELDAQFEMAVSRASGGGAATVGVKSDYSAWRI